MVVLAVDVIGNSTAEGHETAAGGCRQKPTMGYNYLEHG
jgi:hypothetical protein